MTEKPPTAGRCAVCEAPPTRCFCHAIPRLDLRTRICLVIHHRELARRSNTGLLALRALANSELRVRGERRETLDLTDLLTPTYRTFLFYPSEDAQELERELVLREPTPIQLIVPDGTWRQARKLYTRHRELREVPRLMVGAPREPPLQLRAQSRPERMATLQAVAHALGIIEGDAVGMALMRLYQAKVESTLIGRGVLRPTQSRRRFGKD